MNTTKIHRTTIRGISKQKLHALKKMASQNHRSLNAELLIAIDNHLVSPYIKQLQNQNASANHQQPIPQP